VEIPLYPTLSAPNEGERPARGRRGPSDARNRRNRFAQVEMEGRCRMQAVRIIEAASPVKTEIRNWPRLLRNGQRALAKAFRLF
jgi:hypothetical protein